MFTNKEDNNLGNETISDSSENEANQDVINVNKEEKHSYDLGRWTLNEHQLFLEALVKYGNEWKQIQDHIRTRSSAQARSHAQKYFIRLKKEFRGLADVNVIKQKIHQKFQYELQDNFTPQNLNYFLDIMIKLIYIHESNITNYASCSFPKKKLKIKQLAVRCSSDKKKKIEKKKGPKGVKKRKANDKKIFKIERSNKRKQSLDIDLNAKLDVIANVDIKNTASKKTNRVKSHIGNIKTRIIKSKAKTKVPQPCINYFTFNMYDNSFNNYLNTNLKHIQSNSSIAMPMNQSGINPIDDIGGGNVFGLETKETKSNPFFIQFDPEEGQMKNDIDNNNIIQENNFNDFFTF